MLQYLLASAFGRKYAAHVVLDEAVRKFGHAPGTA